MNITTEAPRNPGRPRKYNSEAERKAARRAQKSTPEAKAKRNEQLRAYRKRNADRIAEQKWKYREKNRAKIAEQHRAHRVVHREKIAERNRAYNVKKWEINKELLAEIKRLIAACPPEHSYDLAHELLPDLPNGFLYVCSEIDDWIADVLEPCGEA